LDNVLKYFESIFDNLKLNENKIVELYSSPDEEINSVKYGVGLYNRSESAVIHLKGKDVLDFLQRISTNDVKNIEPYHYVSTLFTNEKGRLIDRTILVRLEDDYFLVGGKKTDALLDRWINKFIITEDVLFENKTGEYLILDVIGPQAESYLTMICGENVDDLDNNKLHEIEINNTNSYLLKKTASSGENIYWLISEKSNFKELFDYLLSHRSVFDLSMVGEYAFDYYRVINKVPKNPNEINDKYNPHEVGLINDVSFTKGCYIGQEVIARLDTYDKVQKRLKKVKLEGISSSKTPMEIFNSKNELVGILTTVVKSLENSHFEGLAFLRNSVKKEEDSFYITETEEKNMLKLKIVE